jgi:hypothetical protein
MSDQRYRIGVLAGAVVLVAVITYLRFCGSVGLPPKPAPPTGPTGTQTQLLSKSTGSPEVYKSFIESDASSAGVRVPSLAEMAKKFPYRVDEARHVLEPMENAAATEALRNALSSAKGEPLVGVINSIAKRKDRAAVPALIKMLYASDPMVAEAAAWALGSISGTEAARALEEALAKTKGRLRDTVAAAALASAEGLIAAGRRDRAMALYNRLDEPDIPKQVRLAAMHMTIAAETSMTRPR